MYSDLVLGIFAGTCRLPKPNLQGKQVKLGDSLPPPNPTLPKPFSFLTQMKKKKKDREDRETFHD